MRGPDVLMRNEPMPKTYYDLWDDFISWSNFVVAAFNASSGKKFKLDVLEYKWRLEHNVIDLINRLKSGTWYPGKYKEFNVFEPKKRVIHAPCYEDRVLHHALTQIILPLFERKFIHPSFACREDKGTHAASEYLRCMMQSAADRWDRAYVLKADISKYFYSIDHEILLSIISKTVGDPKVFEIIRRLVQENDCSSGGVGLPLGALTSQLFANVYLDQLDHYIKDKLSVKHYVRYMDDFIVLLDDKYVLNELLKLVTDFLNDRLKLKLNDKTIIYPMSQGIDFAGYRHWLDHVLPRKRNLVNAKRRFQVITVELKSDKCKDKEKELKKARGSLASFNGYMKHCDGYRSFHSTVKHLDIEEKNQWL